MSLCVMSSSIEMLFKILNYSAAFLMVLVMSVVGCPYLLLYSMLSATSLEHVSTARLTDIFVWELRNRCFDESFVWPLSATSAKWSKEMS